MILSLDTKTSTTTSVISDDSSNNDKNKLLTTESDEDDNAGSDYDNINSDNNRSLSDASFVKQESNIFILDKAKLQQIVAMGFPDIDLNATALFESNNNVEQAIEIILKRQQRWRKEKRAKRLETITIIMIKDHMRTERMRKEHDKGLPNEEDRPVNYKSKLCQILFNMVRADMVNLAIMLTPRQN